MINGFDEDEVFHGTREYCLNCRAMLDVTRYYHSFRGTWEWAHVKHTPDECIRHLRDLIEMIQEANKV